jgi:AcrR family transcriptional regulator
MTGNSKSRGKSATVQRVLEATHALIAERGYHGATVRDIAQRAGIAAAGVLETFPSKRDLFIAVIIEAQDERVRRAHAAFAEKSGDPKAAILAAFIAAHHFDLECGMRFVRETAAVAYTDPKSFTPRLLQVAEAFYDPICAILRDLQARCVLRADVSIRAAVMHLSGVHFELLKVAGFGTYTTVEYEREMTHIADMWWRGITARD